MTIKLTKRDKVLIIILVYAVIVFLFLKLLILPALDAKALIEDEIAVKNEEKFNMEMIISTLDSLKLQAENMEAEIATLAQDFYPMMNTKQIDDLVTNMLIDYDLDPYSLDMGDGPQLVGIVPYFASKFSLEGYDASLPEAIYTATVSCTATGTREDFMRLFDRLVDEKAIGVENFTIEERSYYDNEVTHVEETWIALTLSIYIYDAASLDAQVTQTPAPVDPQPTLSIEG